METEQETAAPKCDLMVLGVRLQHATELNNGEAERKKGGVHLYTIFEYIKKIPPALECTQERHASLQYYS